MMANFCSLASYFAAAAMVPALLSFICLMAYVSMMQAGSACMAQLNTGSFRRPPHVANSA
jgi:hypothetical protein